MGSVASFLAQFTQGLTGTLQQHHAEQKKLELKESDQQLQTLQMAAQQAASTGDTRAYGMILRKIGDFTSTGSGKAGKAGKQNIMHQFADMLDPDKGVEEQQEVPNLPQSGFEPQMGFNQQGQPSLTPKPPEVLAAQNQALERKQFELVRKPLFMSEEERLTKDVNRLTKMEDVKSVVRQKELKIKNDAALEIAEAKARSQASLLGIRTTAAFKKELMDGAVKQAGLRGDTEVTPLDIMRASQLFEQEAKDKHDRDTATIAKIKQDVKDAPAKLRMMQERITNTYKIGTERNRILAGQLNLGQSRFNYEVTNKKAIDSLENEYNKINSQLLNIEDHIMSASKDGNVALRSENIQEAERLKTRKGQIEAELEQRLSDTAGQAISQKQGYSPQAGVQTVVPPQLKPNTVTVGQKVRLTLNGKVVTVTITKVNSDGTFDYDQ